MHFSIKSVETLQKAHLKEPKKLPFEIVVAVPPGATAQSTMQMFGNLKRLTPEEIDHAVIFKIASEIKAGSSIERLQQQS